MQKLAYKDSGWSGAPTQPPPAPPSDPGAEMDMQAVAQLCQFFESQGLDCSAIRTAAQNEDKDAIFEGLADSLIDFVYKQAPTSAPGPASVTKGIIDPYQIAAAGYKVKQRARFF